MLKPKIFLLTSILVGCALQPPTYIQTDSLDKYRFVEIEAKETVSSVQGGRGGYLRTVKVDPASLIEGVLLKRGVVKVREPSPHTAGKLLVARYGISGKRNIAGGVGGYAQEVTVVLVDAATLVPVFTCTAEGIGSTEADDIREAIILCLEGLR